MILNTFLNNMAKAIGNEAYVYPSYLAADTALTAVLSTDTVLPGEKGVRSLVTYDVVDNTATYTATRSGTNVTTSAGDNLTAFALLSASTGGTLLSEITVGTLNQSTSFDIEAITTITFNRA
jgi:hypothetical protein